MTAPPVIRLVLADDESLTRGAVGALLGLEPDIEVVAEAGDGRESGDPYELVSCAGNSAN